MLDQQRLIDEYELLRRQSLECGPRSTQRVTLALRAVMEGGMVVFMRCCSALLSTRPARPIRPVAVTRASLPSAELTHALAGMVLAIVSQERRP